MTVPQRADRPTVLALGEALVDVVHSPGGEVREHPGGSVANVAVALARLGVPVALATWIGDDQLGRALATTVEREGVQLVPGSTSAPRTSTALARLDGDGVADYEFDVHWSVPHGLEMATARAVHTGSLAAWLEPGATAVSEFVARARAGSTITYDPNVRPALAGADVAAGVERFVRVADVVKVSADDLAALGAAEPLAEARRWLTLGPALVVVTMGERGAVGMCAAGEFRYHPPAPALVVDTVGAGDAFMGALLWGLGQAGLLGAAVRPALRALDLPRLARLVTTASRAAELSVGRPGADPPTLAQLQLGMSQTYRVTGGCLY